MATRLCAIRPVSVNCGQTTAIQAENFVNDCFEKSSMPFPVTDTYYYNVARCIVNRIGE